jgi:putative ABC transport system ATP-binding protein
VAVMGPSGSGKSTLLAIAGSLEEPTSGEVLVSGSALSAMTPNQRAQLRRRAIGYVFQDFNLLAGLSAVENVALPLELDGVGQRAAHASGLAALDELGLADQAGRFPDELSGGERQRVAIARAAPAVGRRADRRPGLGQWRVGDAPAARRLQAGGRWGHGDPRRAPGVLG